MEMSSAKSRRSLPAMSNRNVSTELGLVHDLDLYYIRQIANHLKEYDLEQKIDVEIRIREGTTKLLAACQHPSQALEAAKTLHVSNERMTVYTNELQVRKQATCARQPSSSSRTGKGAWCTGRLGLTDLRLPLMWKDTDHFKNRGDYRRFAVFCLAKVGTEVLDSSLVTPVDRAATDITFADSLVFCQARADFNLKLEVYSCMLQDDLSMASTPRKLQKSLHSSISRTLGRKLSAALKDSAPKTDAGPKFDLVATATLSLGDVHDSVKSHDLVLENLENPCHQLPLFDTFCCRLAAQPGCLSSDATTFAVVKRPLLGAAAHQTSKTGDSQAPLVYVSLHGFDLRFWRKKEHRDANKRPLLFVNLDPSTTVTNTTDRGDVTIATYFDYTETVIELRTQDADWIGALHQRVADGKAWGYAARKVMQIHEPQETGSSPESQWTPRTGSLYEDTPLFEDPKSKHKRPTVHDVFQLPRHPAPSRSHSVVGLPRLPPAPPPAASPQGAAGPGLLAPPPPSPPPSTGSSSFGTTRSRSSSSTSTSSGSLPSWGSIRGLPNFWRFTRSSMRK